MNCGEGIAFSKLLSEVQSIPLHIGCLFIFGFFGHTLLNSTCQDKTLTLISHKLCPDKCLNTCTNDSFFSHTFLAQNEEVLVLVDSVLLSETNALSG